MSGEDSSSTEELRNHELNDRGATAQDSNHVREDVQVVEETDSGEGPSNSIKEESDRDGLVEESDSQDRDHNEEMEDVLIQDSSDASDFDEDVINQEEDINAHHENYEDVEDDIPEQFEDDDDDDEEEMEEEGDDDALPAEFQVEIQRQHHADIPSLLSQDGFRRWRHWLLRHMRLRRGNRNPDDGSIEMPQNITFDKNLPTSHSYLGEMEECSGVAYKDQDTYQNLQIVHVHDFVLVPGQTVPMQFSRLSEISMLRRIMAQPDKTFGVLMMNTVEENAQTKNLHSFGCTAEIRSYQDSEEFEINTLRIVIIGRQKFQVIEKRSQIDGNVLAKVKILEDVELPELNNSVGMCKKCGLKNPNHKSNASIRIPSNSFAETHYRKWAVTRHAASSTALPSWIYRMYDVDFLRMQIFKEMREWNQKLEERQCPLDATAFSYWVITNFPISDTWRLRLLQLKSAVQRLRCELDLLQKCTILTCADCAQQIANRRDVFSMSVAGPMAAYVNPGGVVHETLTLYKATGIYHIGKKTTEHSWFPGYAWTICDCQSCGRHMGWKFTATTSRLTPQSFWGFTRSALTPRVPELEGENVSGEDGETIAYQPPMTPLS